MVTANTTASTWVPETRSPGRWSGCYLKVFNTTRTTVPPEAVNGRLREGTLAFTQLVPDLVTRVQFSLKWSWVAPVPVIAAIVDGDTPSELLGGPGAEVGREERPVPYVVESFPV